MSFYPIKIKKISVIQTKKEEEYLKMRIIIDCQSRFLNPNPWNLHSKNCYIPNDSFVYFVGEKSFTWVFLGYNQ